MLNNHTPGSQGPMQALAETCMDAGRQLDIREVAAFAYTQAALAQASNQALINYLIKHNIVHGPTLDKYLTDEYLVAVQRMTNPVGMISAR